MLRELSVTNLALIEDLHIELQSGFTVWTGETGAGKSLLLGGLGLLLGDRGTTDLIRAGADEMRITGRFEIARPELQRAVAVILDEPAVVEELILSRRLNHSGRGAAYINDRPVAVATLKSLGEVLVDLHDQRESHSLLQPAYQLQLLDAFGHLEECRAKYQRKADQVRSIRLQYRGLTELQSQRQRDLALIRFEREELDNADLQPNEVAQMLRERDRLINAGALQSTAFAAANQLYDDEGSIVERLGKLLKEIDQWTNIEPRFGELARRLEAAQPELEDIASTFRDLADEFEVDPDRLDEIERRLQQIRRLEKKYAKPFDELIAYHASLEAREAELQGQNERLDATQCELNGAYSELLGLAKELSVQRGKVAKKLAAEAQKHLVELGMPEAKLDAVLTTTPLGSDSATSEIPALGIDQLELKLAANRGEPSRPLRKVASGGELSRTMLALKSVLAAHDPVGTLIFDEIDANVGGRLGDVLGQKLARLAQTHQVICVTHLPQVAAYAKHHWTIRKQSKGKRTSTSVVPLTENGERLEELAAMLRGDSRGETTREEAAAMLRRGQAR